MSESETAGTVIDIGAERHDYVDFVDSYERRVIVRRSSAGGGSVWIFTSDAATGRSVNHWKEDGGWELARRPGEGDPPWEPGQPMGLMSEGWSSIAPHLSPDDCRKVIAALETHLRACVESDAPDDAVKPEDLATMEQVERGYIERVLESVDGNKSRAARILGFDRRTMYRKLARWAREDRVQTSDIEAVA